MPPFTVDAQIIPKKAETRTIQRLTATALQIRCKYSWIINGILFTDKPIKAGMPRLDFSLGGLPDERTECEN